MSGPTQFPLWPGQTTAWFSARAVNAGAASAKNLVIDFEVDGASKVVLALETASSLLAMTPNPKKVRKTSRTEYRYIDSWSSARVRERIKSLPPGGTEDIVSFGLVVPSAVPGYEHTFVLRYRTFDDSVGVGVGVGAITMIVKWDETPTRTDR